MSLCFRYDIITNCWKDDPGIGPSFENLRKELKEMEDQHKVGLWSLRRDYVIMTSFTLSVLSGTCKHSVKYGKL